MLADREAAYQKDKTVIKPTPAMYKNEYPYLKEVDSLALANVQLDLQEAYHRFFTQNSNPENEAAIRIQQTTRTELWRSIPNTIRSVFQRLDW